MIDVPLFIETCGCEEDPADQSVDSLNNKEDYKSFLLQYFQKTGWKDYQNLTLSILDLYQEG